MSQTKKILFEKTHSKEKGIIKKVDDILAIKKVSQNIYCGDYTQVFNKQQKLILSKAIKTLSISIKTFTFFGKFTDSIHLLK